MTQQEFGSRPLSRATNAVYWAVAVEVFWVLASAPGLVLLLLLRPDASNLPLVALGLVPLGPATGAALYAWRAYLATRDTTPVAHLVRGYRSCAPAVLRCWVPALALLAVLGTNLANLGAVDVPAGLRAGLGVITAVVLAGVVVATAHALVLTALFDLRTRDAARLAVHYLAARPRASLGAASLVVLTAGAALVVADWLPVLGAWLLVLLLLRGARPIITDVEERFTS